ncbi:RNA-directed DNA polymerase, eukaryota, reverse transcriptase zinc-binding domain protein, partial [Tanacetum coccineum]
VLVIVAAAGWLVWFWGDDATKGGSENVVSSPAGYIPISSIMKDVNDNVVKNDGKDAAKISFASILQNQPSKKTVKITELYNNEVVEGGGVAMLLQWKEVSSRFTNTLYGYFIGKRLAFPLVENYVKNTWAKYGLKRVMLDESFFFFQFETKEGMESVIENGSWLIRNILLILVSWGRNAYARALIEVSAEKQLMEEIVIAVPYDTDELKKSHAIASIRRQEDRLNSMTRNKILLHQEDSRNYIAGIKMSKPPVSYYYHKVEKGETSSSQAANDNKNKVDQPKANLSLHKAFIWDRSWCLMGDFNAALFLDDSSMGRSSIDISMREFNECVEEIEVMDVNNTGLKFKSLRNFLALPNIRSLPGGAKDPHGFKRLVQENWSSNVSGFRMFQVVSKLKNPKRPLQKLLFDHGNIHSNVKSLRYELDKV